MSYVISLKDSAYNSLLKNLSDFKNIPGPKAEAAFKAILEMFEECLRCGLEAKYHVAALDPGVGKSQLVAAFVRAWKLAGFAPEGGILICLSRLDEIQAYVKACGLKWSEYAIVVSDKAYVDRGLHRGDPNTAKVVFTTQQMFKVKTQGKRFADVTDYHYQGMPRALKIWDETIDPAEPVALRVDDIASLLAPLRTSYGLYAEALDDLIRQTNLLVEGAIIDVPDHLASGPEVSAIGPKAHLAGSLTDRQSQLVGDLRACAGRPMALHKDNRLGWHLVGACKPLPEDFAPAFILDASARCRGTYRVWKDASGNVTMLPSATIDYGALTVRTWNTGSGRTALANTARRNPIIGAVADVIQKKSDEEWLVVHHQLDGVNWQAELEAQIPRSTKVDFVHWGDHHGTNKFCRIPNVIVIGLFRYPKLSYSAAYSVASGSPAKTDEQISRIQFGEVSSNLLQAVCRSRVRQGSNGFCGKADVWLVGSVQANLAGLVEQTFPGCKQGKWEPRLKSLDKMGLDALAELLRVKSLGRKAATKKEVRSSIGVTVTQRFTELLNKPEMQLALADHGIEVTTREFRFPFGS